jgi:HSP20 family molecular chaperone IbpA
VKKNNESCYELTYVLPGFKKEDVAVSVNDYQLKVFAKTENRSYEDTIAIGSCFDRKNITSKLENGILTVNLPKKPQESSEVKIKIQ